VVDVGSEEVGVGVSVASNDAQLDVVTQIDWPAEPLHCEKVVVEAQVLPDGVEKSVLVRVGRSVS
jgi:hypothetical protein